MKLLYREAAKAQIASFISQYEEGFFELYRDTGLWSEHLIVEGIRANGNKLFDNLYDVIDAGLSEIRVLGRKKLKQEWHEVNFHVGDRLIIVHYSEDAKRRTRWVESISIDRKPIIF